MADIDAVRATRDFDEVGEFNPHIRSIIAYNTDYSGFIKSYDFHFKQKKPGKILVIGVGGVGRAVIFALSLLGVKELCLLDTDAVKSEYMLKELKQLNISLLKILNYQT